MSTHTLAASRAGGRPKRPKVRLAEEPGPPLELEAAIEAREAEVFVAAVKRARDGLTDEEARVLAEAAARRPADLAPDLSWLKDAGVLTAEELRDLEQELRARQPGHAHGYGPSYPADRPTDAAPGSEEKIRVMRDRLRRKQALHHPRDRKLPQGVFAAGLLSPPTSEGEGHGD